MGRAAALTLQRRHEQPVVDAARATERLDVVGAGYVAVRNLGAPLGRLPAAAEPLPRQDSDERPARAEAIAQAAALPPMHVPHRESFVAVT